MGKIKIKKSEIIRTPASWGYFVKNYCKNPDLMKNQFHLYDMGVILDEGSFFSFVSQKCFNKSYETIEDKPVEPSFKYYFKVKENANYLFTVSLENYEDFTNKSNTGDQVIHIPQGYDILKQNVLYAFKLSEEANPKTFAYRSWADKIRVLVV